MKTISVEVAGISSLLQHGFGIGALADGETRQVVVDRGTPREQAEAVVYRDMGKGFYFPGAAIARLLREAGGGHKLKGSRKSLKYLVPAAVIVNEDHILIGDGNGGLAKDFEVDSRPVTIPATKGRIMRHRPRWDKWSAAFSLTIDETVLPLAIVQTLLTEGGMRVGVGDYRPEKGGPFGRFHVTRWEAVE